MSAVVVTAEAARMREAGFGVRLLALWSRLRRLPGGRWLFSRFVGRLAPYTGSIGALVVALEPGRCEVRMRDRRRVRNHLRSIHAIALANLGELASGLAAVSALPPGVRGIPTALTVEYHRKARGTLSAVGTAAPADAAAAEEMEAQAGIVDAEGELVATVRVRWRLDRIP
jgi:acyl-coenzyme A thioesterase PaaI-like protein